MCMLNLRQFCGNSNPKSFYTYNICSVIYRLPLNISSLFVVVVVSFFLSFPFFFFFFLLLSFFVCFKNTIKCKMSPKVHKEFESKIYSPVWLMENCMSLPVQVDIPKGYSSEKFVIRKFFLS